jgi:Xaa-Pro aminopeptidase
LSVLSTDGCRARVARLRERLERGWEAAVIHRPEHLLYFANFFPSRSSLNVHSSSFLLVERDGPATLFTDNWLRPEAEGAAADALEIADWYDFKGPARPRARAVAAALCERLKSLGVGRLAAELSHLPAQVLGAARSADDIEPLILEMREVKDRDEIAAIRRGVRVAEAVHAASRALLRPGLPEMEYYAGLLERAAAAAGEPFVMMCDLASGPRAAAGGGPPTDRVMQAGELVILDIFPYVAGYRGDITNTLAVGGRPTAAQQEGFAVVAAALAAGECRLQPGTPVRDVAAAMNAVFVEAERPPLGFHAGHNLGLGHPEAPEIVPGSDRLLAAGMVMALEPGLYDLPGGGIRLEHDYLVTGGGCERLSSHELGLA